MIASFLMPSRLLIVVLIALFGGADGAADGWRGNSLYEAGNYTAAAAAYRAGIDQHDTAEGALYADLWNNLGAALYRDESYADAGEAFRTAADVAETPFQQARALYNAGNTAVAQDQLEVALDLYRRALLAAPDYDDARFNYEYLKRQMAKHQQQPSSSSDRPEPSAFARDLKRRADSLVTNRQYEDAYRLMQDGLQQDSTVAAFRSFITRLGEVSQINSMTP
jgi:tetratricopeptide (TPR) repeat protein